MVTIWDVWDTDEGLRELWEACTREELDHARIAAMQRDIRKIRQIKQQLEIHLRKCECQEEKVFLRTSVQRCRKVYKDALIEYKEKYYRGGQYGKWLFDAKDKSTPINAVLHKVNTADMQLNGEMKNERRDALFPSVTDYQLFRDLVPAFSLLVMTSK